MRYYCNLCGNSEVFRRPASRWATENFTEFGTVSMDATGRIFDSIVYDTDNFDRLESGNWELQDGSRIGCGHCLDNNRGDGDVVQLSDEDWQARVRNRPGVRPMVKPVAINKEAFDQIKQRIIKGAEG